MKIVRSVNVPRGGWSITMPDTGVRISGGSVNALARKVRAHMESNGIRVPEPFREWIEDQACRNLSTPKHWCRDVPEHAEEQRSGWSKRDVRRFLVSVHNWAIKHRFAFVGQEEADRRASTCAGCPENVKISGCLGCSGVLNLVRTLRRGRRTAFDNHLNMCNICGCELKVKCLLPFDALDNGGLTYPEHCWLAARTTEHDAANRPETEQDRVDDKPEDGVG